MSVMETGGKVLLLNSVGRVWTKIVLYFRVFGRTNVPLLLSINCSRCYKYWTVCMRECPGNRGHGILYESKDFNKKPLNSILISLSRTLMLKLDQVNF